MDNTIKDLINKIFVQIEVDYQNPQVVPAIITAASVMANYTDITTSEEVTQVLLEIYNIDQNAKNLIGCLSPQFVNSIIGFPVDYENKAQAQMAYIANSNIYDELYYHIRTKALLSSQRKF